MEQKDDYEITLISVSPSSSTDSATVTVDGTTNTEDVSEEPKPSKTTEVSPETKPSGSTDPSPNSTNSTTEPSGRCF